YSNHFRLYCSPGKYPSPAGRMSENFGSPDEIEKPALGTELNRCRALASKIANELRNKRPEHFVDKLSLADVHASLERAADVLSTVKGSQARGRREKDTTRQDHARKPAARRRQKID